MENEIKTREELVRAFEDADAAWYATTGWEVDDDALWDTWDAAKAALKAYDKEEWIMRLHYPIGTQYHDVIGNGSLAGIADEILDIAKNHQEWLKREDIDRKERTRHRWGGAPKLKKLTEAMMRMLKYIKKHPGARHFDLINTPQGCKKLSMSCIRDNLKALVQHGLIETKGTPRNLIYYAIRVENDQK